MTVAQLIIHLFKFDLTEIVAIDSSSGELGIEGIRGIELDNKACVYDAKTNKIAYTAVVLRNQGEL